MGKNRRDAAVLRRPPRIRASFTAQQRVWVLTIAIALSAAVVARRVADLPTLYPLRTIPWWVAAMMFYVGEITVVHAKFKRNTHSFSMGEFPLVLGLFFVSPVALLGAQLVGNAAALVINRRQPPLKLLFNLSQFTLVAGLGIVVFRAIGDAGDPFGPMGWLAAVTAVVAGVLVANSLIHLAIRLSGGNLGRAQVTEVFYLSTGAAAINSALALLAVTLYETRPSSVWLAAIPPFVLYGAYRAYVGQRQERERLESLYDATKALHAAPQIDRAMAAAATHALQMFNAERVDIVLVDIVATDRVFHIFATTDGTVQPMQQMILPGDDHFTEKLAQVSSAYLVGDDPPLPQPVAAPAAQAIAAPLLSSDRTLGIIVVTEPLADIADFQNSDVKLLEALAAKITVSLENGRLEDSLAELTQLKEQLEDQVRSKDQFIATVSHELRTPLTTVLGLSQELQLNRSSFDEREIDEIIDLVANESAELANLIEDLLVGARADIEALVLSPQIVDLRAELDTIIEGHTYRSGRDTVCIEASQGSPKVWADPLRLRQIIRNLLTNAHRYGGDRIWVEIVDRGPQVSISVIDDGDGVPPRSESAIFEAYEGAHRGVAPGSVGLGLAVSRTLAELMNGRLIYRRHGDTTCFVLTLPSGPQAA